MNFFDKLLKVLQSLIPDVKITFNIKNLHIGDSISGPKTQVDQNTGTLQINPNNLSSEEKDKVKHLFREATDEKEIILLRKNSTALLEDFKSNDPLIYDKEILEALRPYIPLPDFIALRASLYLRVKYKRNEGVSDLKKDILNRFGVRGKNIANLCTSGYFEELILPLLEELKKIADIETFKNLYEIIIKESAFAVFVNRTMSDEDVKTTIISRIEKNRKYGLPSLNIHGLGKKNVKKIKDTISELQSRAELSFEIIKEESVTGNFIFLTLSLKSSSTSDPL